MKDVHFLNKSQLKASGIYNNGYFQLIYEPLYKEYTFKIFNKTTFEVRYQIFKESLEFTSTKEEDTSKKVWIRKLMEKLTEDLKDTKIDIL